jgi:hypothetical protein
VARSTQMTATGWRIVETGRSPGGLSTIIGDSAVNPVELATRRRLSQLWQTDRIYDALERGSATGLFPQANGLRSWVLKIPPDSSGSRTWPTRHRHITETIGIGFVQMGDVTPEMEDGTRCVLDPHDAFVQCGTAHRGINDGRSPAAIGLIVVGAEATPRDPSRKEPTCT